MPTANSQAPGKRVPLLHYLERAARREALSSVLVAAHEGLTLHRSRNPSKRQAAHRLVDVFLGFRCTVEQDINKLLMRLDGPWSGS